MTAENLVFHPVLQEAIDEGVLSAATAWALEWDSLLFPDDEVPEHLLAAWQRVQMFHAELPLSA